MEPSQKRYDIIYAGNYTKDTIITPGGTRYVDGGGFNYAAHAGARLGLKTAAVTRLALEDKKVVDAIESDGIDCYPTYTPSSTLMTLEYKTTNVDIRNLFVKAVAGTITASQFDGLEARAIVISPSIRGEVEPVFFETMRKRDDVIISADVQGFVRVLRDQMLVYEPWDEMAQVLRNVDILKSDAVEAEFLTGEKDIEKAARAFARMGPKEIILTHKDGVLIYAQEKAYHYEFFTKNLDGRSGRGDTCVGAYVAKRLSLTPEEAGKWAAAVTSLKMEKLGVFDRSILDVETFIQDNYNNNPLVERRQAQTDLGRKPV